MKHILSYGITIEDNRHIGCGINISSNYMFIPILYSKKLNTFIINVESRMYDISDIDEYIDDLNIRKQVLKEANELLK